ncbi:MAG: hypothetical protein ACYDEA_03800 [Candidatus Dormibacteria bacterium]
MDRRRVGVAAVGILLLAGVMASRAVVTKAPPSSHASSAGGTAQLMVLSGAESLSVSAASLGGELYRARVSPPGAAIITTPQDGEVVVSQGHSASGSTHLAIELSRRVAWTIFIRGGTTACALDLSGLRLDGLTVSGGAETMTLRLPKAVGKINVAVTGGATHLSVSAPSGIAMRVFAGAGVGSVSSSGPGMVVADNSHLITFGNYAAAANSYVVRLTAGAATLSVIES